MSYFKFSYAQPTKLVFGPGTEVQAGQLLSDFGAKKVLITLGGGSVRKSGLLQRVTDSLDEKNIGWALYEGCRANPEASWVNNGAKVYAAENCDFLLAIGGGSVIDATKAIALLATNPGDSIWPYLTYEMNFQQPAAPLGVVLTIAATGSECDASFVISDDSDKLLFSEDSTLPRFALCNPELTYSVSPWQTACGTADILSHLLEQYLYCDNGCSVSDEMLLGLMKSVIKWGPVALREAENFDARANLMLCSTIAMNGLVGVGHDQNWVSHCMEHAVSAVWPNVAHGAGMACILPAYLKLIAPEDVCGKQAHLGEVLFGIAPGEDAALQTAEAFGKFFASLGLPATLKALVGEEPSQEQLDVVVAKSFPWGPMVAGGYPEFGENEAKALIKML